MFDAGRRPMGWLSYWLMTVVMIGGCQLRAGGAVPQSGPPTTTVADTVYLADGSRAQGNLIIIWPAFVTASGAAVAGSTLNTTLGANGALSVALVPNAGASPAGSYYTVVYQLGPGEVRTEYWVVPTTSPANLAAVRTTPGAGVAGQAVSLQYVNSGLATKANDNAVVHLSGTETISGTKTFSAAPTVPAPTGTGQVTNKAYVDQSISNVGAGVYLPTAGGAMTGAITLPGNPAAALQAAPKQYVDQGFAVKADLISGLVPANELGTGTASAGSCLLGNGTWGACGSGGGTGNVSTAPSVSQNVAQPEGTQFSANNLANIRYVTPSWNWLQSPTDNLATAGNNTLHLNPCPAGIDTSNTVTRPYSVYIAGVGTPEAALVTGGTCTSGLSSGTILVTTLNTHGAGYTVGSATSGIEEALNDGGTTGAAIVIPPTGANANALPVYSTIYVQSNRGSLRGEGKPTLVCKTRSVCMFIGDRASSNDFAGIEVSGIRFAAGNTFDGMQITNTACAAGVSTITLNNSGASAVQAGDYVDVNWTFTPHYYGIHVVASASGTQFTYADANCGGATTIASQASAGFASLENAAIEDDGNGTDLHDIYLADKTSNSSWGVWQNQIVVDNDQAFKLDTVNIDEGAHCTTNYCGQAIYFPGPFSVNAGVAWLSHLNLSLQCGGNGVTEWAGNTLRIQNSVIQGFAQWGVFTGTSRGGYGGGQFDDVYSEVGNCANPMYPGTGAQKQAMAGLLNNSNSYTGMNSVRGGEFPVGQLPQFAASGNQGTRYNYCFVVHDTSAGVSRCLQFGYALVDSASPSGNIVLSWPRVQGTGTVSYDVIRYSGTGLGMIGPYTGGCGGGSTTACGSVVVTQAQCSTSLCNYTDTANLSTTSYAVPASGYVPGIFWMPGGVVTLNATDWATFTTSSTFLENTDVVTPLSPIVTEGGLMTPQVFSERCSNVNGNEWVSCLAGNSSGNNNMPNATVLQYGVPTGAPVANLKGRLNFTSSQSAAMNSGEIVTLVDSNPAKTLATPGYRPSQDAGDTFLGTDSGSVNYANVGLAMGAPISISSYINAIPSGSNYLERLTAAGKTFNVPVTVNGNLAVKSGSVTLPISGSGSQCLHVSSTGVLSGTGTDCGSGGGSGTVNSGTASQVAMYAGSGATVSGDGALTDNGTLLNYSGSGGISATAGTFSGNVTVNGQLMVAGPWVVSSPVPGTAMPGAGAGTSALGISNDGNFYISANGATPVKVATSATSSYFSNLWQEDANDLGIYNGTNAQGLNVYGTRTDASDYERLVLGYDTANTNYFKIDAQGLGTGTKRGLLFWVNGAGRWAIDQVDVLKPFQDNLYDLGSTSFRVRNGYFGTGVVTPSITLGGDALSNVIGTPSANLMTAGTVSGTGQPLCTDGTGNLTITTVGCPPGTGTIGGSGTASQFAYWTNTNGLGAAPLYLTSANTVEQYNGTNAQTLNVYGTYTSATNYERAGLGYVSGDGYYELQTQQGSGGGSQRGFCFGVNNGCKWAVDTNTAFKPFNDNVRDIGTSSLRVRDFYLARNLIMSGTATTYNGKTTAGTGLAPVYGTVSSTGLTAAVGSTTLCASATCGAGQYVVNYYLDSTVTCTTAGSAAASLTIGWTDETSAKTMQVPLSGAGVSGGNSLSLGNTTNFASGTVSLWSAGGANITYSASYTGCTTGTGTYAVRAAVRQLQ